MGFAGVCRLRTRSSRSSRAAQMHIYKQLMPAMPNAAPNPTAKRQRAAGLCNGLLAVSTPTKRARTRPMDQEICQPCRPCITQHLRSNMAWTRDAGWTVPTTARVHTDPAAPAARVLVLCRACGPGPGGYSLQSPRPFQVHKQHAHGHPCPPQMLQARRLSRS